MAPFTTAATALFSRFSGIGQNFGNFGDFDRGRNQGIQEGFRLALSLRGNLGGFMQTPGFQSPLANGIGGFPSIGSLYSQPNASGNILQQLLGNKLSQTAKALQDKIAAYLNKENPSPKDKAEFKNELYALYKTLLSSHYLLTGDPSRLEWAKEKPNGSGFNFASILSLFSGQSAPKNKLEEWINNLVDKIDHNKQGSKTFNQEADKLLAKVEATIDEPTATKVTKENDSSRAETGANIDPTTCRLDRPAVTKVG